MTSLVYLGFPIMALSIVDLPKRPLPGRNPAGLATYLVHCRESHHGRRLSASLRGIERPRPVRGPGWAWFCFLFFLFFAFVVLLVFFFFGWGPVLIETLDHSRHQVNDYLTLGSLNDMWWAFWGSQKKSRYFGVFWVCLSKTGLAKSLQSNYYSLFLVDVLDDTFKRNVLLSKKYVSS